MTLKRIRGGGGVVMVVGWCYGECVVAMVVVAMVVVVMVEGWP